MGFMFCDCNKLKIIKGINNFNTSKVINIHEMFGSYNILNYLNLNNFNNYNVFYIILINYILQTFLSYLLSFSLTYDLFQCEY